MLHDPLTVVGALTAAASMRHQRAGRVGLVEAVKTLIEGRTEIALERERRQTLCEILDRLPEGAEVVEYGVTGRTRTVKIAPRSRRRQPTRRQRGACGD